jgi:hypothetical protein
MKSLWRCCTCFFLLLLGILVALGILIVLLLTPRSTHAQTLSGGCSTFDAPMQAVTLTAAIPLSPSSQTARGIFFTCVITVTLPHNTCVVLASTPDGRGNVWVDDALWLQVQHSDSSLAQTAQDFRAADHTRIVAVAPLDWTSFFTPGDNRVTLTLHDLSPDVYGSSALWLVVFALPTPTPPSGVPIATPLEPTYVSPTQTPTAVIALTDRTPGDPPTTTTIVDSPSILPAVGLALIALITTVLIIVRQRSRETREKDCPIYVGKIELVNEQTYESLSIDLADWPYGFAVFTNPLRVEPWNSRITPPLQIIPLAEGIRLNELDAETSTLLRYGDSTNICGLRVTLASQSSLHEE